MSFWHFPKMIILDFVSLWRILRHVFCSSHHQTDVSESERVPSFQFFASIKKCENNVFMNCILHFRSLFVVLYQLLHDRKNIWCTQISEQRTRSSLTKFRADIATKSEFSEFWGTFLLIAWYLSTFSFRT